ncbi:hypothetical protein [Shewanella gelidii]|uniref:Uncharacterized protein n=1 Tax=Shewanella gelidii TaxID=1642821 RepID=A0A917JT81_9GAMM|nr:hypothetical protein [Shewanella gelidii]MCL1098067.1 hypothetical protein [Shewanella gelidii]GGI85894.1 hypothetical protein GCM10009332_24000 [Shewanella gelidii]
MAINKNNRLKPLHCAYTAGTGGGKAVAVQYAGMMPKSPCLAMFDPYGDYVYKTGCEYDTGFAGKRTYHYATRAAFAEAFKNAWGSKKPFRIGYKPENPTRDEMLWFCNLMWLASDGHRRLDVVIEELAKWCDSTGKEQSSLGQCFTGGRKFGLVMHPVFQRSTEVPKTILAMSPYKIVGMQETLADATRMAKECGVDVQDILALEELTYIKKNPKLGDVEPFSLKHVFDD